MKLNPFYLSQYLGCTSALLTQACVIKSEPIVWVIFFTDVYIQIFSARQPLTIIRSYLHPKVLSRPSGLLKFRNY